MTDHHPDVPEAITQAGLAEALDGFYLSVRMNDGLNAKGQVASPGEVAGALYATLSRIAAERQPDDAPAPPPPVAAAFDRGAAAGWDWHRYGVNMAEPGYIAVHCFRDAVWDQFPLFEGKVDLKCLDDWARDHERRYHEEAAASEPGKVVRLCPTCLHDGVLERVLERAGAALWKLASLRAVLLEGGQDAGTARRRALAIIGGEEGSCDA